MKEMNAKTPEILAPVADWEMCRAAVHNGADAIYLGMPGFNARGRAPTLTLEELGSMINFCHLYDVKVFIAFNVLIFEEELAEVLKILRPVIALHPDAFIVQDLGLIRLIKKLAPQQVVHASTQMTVTNVEAIQLTEGLGIQRYVLGREVSIPEMIKIKSATDKELEVFVHGALCVSYSGQCLTSERIGGRSANRGQCAQSCRLPYDLMVDGKKEDLGDRRYLVSPQDLCSIEQVPQLVAAGIDSFKIEGRLKSPEYVASTVKNYKAQSISPLPEKALAKAQQELAQIYSRGFYQGWMSGVEHQKLVDARFSSHHGLEVGEIIEVEKNAVLVESPHLFSPGDGLVFCDFDRELEFGANIFEVQSTNSALRSRLSFSNEFSLNSLSSGMRVFVNTAPKLLKIVRQSFTDKNRLKRIPIGARLYGSLGQVLRLEFFDQEERLVSVLGTQELSPAKNAPLCKEQAELEIASLSSSPFILEKFEFLVEPSLFIHQRELKELRRKAAQALQDLRISRNPQIQNQDATITEWQIEDARALALTRQDNEAKLHVVVREKEQLEALRGLPLGTVYLDFEFGKEYAPSLEDLKGMGLSGGIASTRILKPGEHGHLKQLQRLKPDSVLVRNLGALESLKDSGLKLVGDFSLNAANSLSTRWLLAQGLTRLCPSYDLNQSQLEALLAAVPAQFFEVTVHQYMPAFHMEHCVFAAFLSKGSSYRDCGRPCEKHRIELKDPSGNLHPVKADAECRNTMFHGTPQAAARLVPSLLDLGVQHFRVEALYETPSELRKKLMSYLDLIHGASTPNTILKDLNLLERYGVSEGQLLNSKNWKDRKKDSLKEIW